MKSICTKLPMYVAMTNRETEKADYVDAETQKEKGDCRHSGKRKSAAHGF